MYFYILRLSFHSKIVWYFIVLYMNRYEINCSFEEQFALVGELIKGLADYNKQFIGDRNDSGIITLSVYEDGKLIGGLHAKFYRNMGDVRCLWVDEKHRKNGLGRQLMNKFEEVATEKNLDTLYTSTYHFQAVDFYLKLGYQYLFTIDNYVQGADLVHFRKKLQ